MLVKINCFIEKQNCKECTISTSSIGSIKTIYILLVKVVILYIRLSIINIQKPGL